MTWKKFGEHWCQRCLLNLSAFWIRYVIINFWLWELFLTPKGAWRPWKFLLKDSYGQEDCTMTLCSAAPLNSFIVRKASVALYLMAKHGIPAREVLTADRLSLFSYLIWVMNHSVCSLNSFILFQCNSLSFNATACKLMQDIWISIAYAFHLMWEQLYLNEKLGCNLYYLSMQQHMKCYLLWDEY